MRSDPDMYSFFKAGALYYPAEYYGLVGLCLLVALSTSYRQLLWGRKAGGCLAFADDTASYRPRRLRNRVTSATSRYTAPAMRIITGPLAGWTDSSGRCPP